MSGGLDAAAAHLDALDEAAARDALTRCCGASRWVNGTLLKRPFGDGAGLLEAARVTWAKMERADVLEAFDHHPRIGADVAKLREKFARTSDWSSGEQASVSEASEAVLTALRDGNVAYEARYGHIFIVCASGKSAAEMLALLQARMDHAPEEELAIAAAEQMKITELRLEKLT